MATHRLLLESLPVSLSVSRLLAEGKITADMTSVWIGFGAIELKRAGTADRKTAQTDRWRPSAPQSPARSRPGPTHVADVCAAAREHCETVGGAARLAHRKVASVMAPTIPLAAIKQ